MTSFMNNLLVPLYGLFKNDVIIAILNNHPPPPPPMSSTVIIWLTPYPLKRHHWHRLVHTESMSCVMWAVVRIRDVSRKKGVKKQNLIKDKFLAKIGDEKMEAALVVIKHGSGIEYE